LVKEILEKTRIGLAVNEARKKTSLEWPDFSKRCRNLIKGWQKIADYRPSSSCDNSSTDGTPNLVSPGLGWRLTPPVSFRGQRVTSTELQINSNQKSTRKDGVNKATNCISPIPNSVHKSVSTGGALCSLKEDAEFENSWNSQQTETLRRSKSSAYQLQQAVVSPTSLLEARKNVQSTAEIIAQLSENISQHIPTDLNSTEHHIRAIPPIPTVSHNHISVQARKVIWTLGCII